MLGPLQVWLQVQLGVEEGAQRKREEQEERPGEWRLTGMLSEGPEGTEVQSKRTKSRKIRQERSF